MTRPGRGPDARSLGDPLLDAVVDYGAATADAARAYAAGDAEGAGAASRAGIVLLGRIYELRRAKHDG